MEDYLRAVLRGMGGWLRCLMQAKGTTGMMKDDSLVKGVSADRTWAGRVGDDGLQGSCQHHDDDLSHDVVPSAACDWRRPRSLESQLQGVACDQGVRHRHPHGRPCVQSGRDRQLLGEDIDKFKTFGLTPVPAKKVTPPLIAECLANIECRVAGRQLGSQVQPLHPRTREGLDRSERKERRTIHHNGDGTFVVDGRVLNLRKKMVKWPDFLD